MEYVILSKETKEVVETLSFGWLNEMIDLKQDIVSLRNSCGKKIQELKIELEEIRRDQDTMFPGIKMKILEEVEKIGNLVDILNLIGNLNENYTKKLYTTYREDEVWYVKTTLEKLERLETYLGWYLNEEKYVGEMRCK
jgi:hypothetical protein